MVETIRRAALRITAKIFLIRRADLQITAQKSLIGRAALRIMATVGIICRATLQIMTNCNFICRLALRIMASCSYLQSTSVICEFRQVILIPRAALRITASYSANCGRTHYRGVPLNLH